MGVGRDSAAAAAAMVSDIVQLLDTVRCQSASSEDLPWIHGKITKLTDKLTALSRVPTQTPVAW